MTVHNTIRQMLFGLSKRPAITNRICSYTLYSFIIITLNGTYHPVSVWEECLTDALKELNYDDFT